MSAASYQATQSEKEFQRAVVEMAAHLGWLCVHFPAMLANPSGWPDLICFRDGKVLVAELKTERGTLGPRQKEWVENLREAGITVHVWRPSSWPAIEATLLGDYP